MIVYSGTKLQFRKDVLTNDIENIVLNAYQRVTQQRVGKSEITSWKYSLASMDRILEDAEIPNDVGVAIEYRIPQTRKRIDFIISGADATGGDVAILTELKQWSEAERTDKDGIVITYLSGGMRESEHPSYRAWTYKRLLEDYNQSIQDDTIQLYPCAYLHNYGAEEDPGSKVITHDFYARYIDLAPVFLKCDALKLRNFIKQHIKYGDRHNLIYRIDHGKIRPSKHLADELVSMLRGKQAFVMIDDQKLVFESALKLAGDAKAGSKKSVMIVEGSAGTGKSVVAVNLLVEMTNREMVAQYVTRNSAPRLVYEAMLTGSFKRSHISNLFSGSGSFYNTKTVDYDCLIVDEAHRLNAESGMFAAGENQIMEIIRASKCAVFFIDEDQRVTLKDIGTKDEIKKWARKLKAQVHEYTLESQFRCNGSNGYLAWLDNTLQLHGTANESLEGLGYDFQMIDSPRELHDLIRKKNALSNKSRMVAGYCWDWVSKKRPALKDIAIADYKATWNLEAHGQAWIIQPDSVNEVGCIHTCQGLELDYVGVIVGPDLIVRKGKVITRPDQRSTMDKSIHTWRRLMEENPTDAKLRLDQIIKNTYRTLMTRGQKGCYVYCVDKETQEYFRAQMGAAEVVFPEVASRIQILDEPAGKRYVEYLPIYSMEVAAGRLDKQSVAECLGWVKTPSGIKGTHRHFVARISGKSMEPKIPDGSYAVFQYAEIGNMIAGARSGKVVLAVLSESIDPENGGRYTVKKYQSQKVVHEDGQWEHVSIQLLPLNPAFKPIVIQPSEAESMKIVAEYIGLL